ncbi:hypothetical protein PGTUg99_007834 [Puccinia graminis f. sp. tritici]|uniref:Uncharacterized protein n=1 Tax=Puccinia graminis f. sp. tritici TaxID=56615 RepID=A0A5B0SC36_PUCGR|nr:hypothetical protein PGTUg99_007834 [Puccinia graminis f. sp. tritici]
MLYFSAVSAVSAVSALSTLPRGGSDALTFWVHDTLGPRAKLQSIKHHSLRFAGCIQLTEPRTFVCRRPGRKKS